MLNEQFTRLLVVKLHFSFIFEKDNCTYIRRAPTLKSVKQDLRNK